MSPFDNTMASAEENSTLSLTELSYWFMSVFSNNGEPPSVQDVRFMLFA